MSIVSIKMLMQVCIISYYLSNNKKPLLKFSSCVLLLIPVNMNRSVKSHNIIHVFKNHLNNETKT
jgi:hypothetical protein